VELREFTSSNSALVVVEDKAIKFSELTAAQLATLLSENIQTFPTDVWIKEDLSGAAVLAGVAPSEFLNFLEITVGISSGFMKSRVLAKFIKIIGADPSLASHHSSWVDVSRACSQTVHKIQQQEVKPNSLLSPVQRNLDFSSPMGGASGVLTADGKAFNYQALKCTPRAQSPAFLSQIPSKSALMDDSMLFTKYEGEQTGRVQSSFVGDTPSRAAAMGGGIEITIRQPSVLPKYEVLENAKDAEAMYTWVRKTRKENLIADDADRKPFRNLLGQDAKYEIVRYVNQQRKTDPENSSGLFDDSAPFPSKWVHVTDTLILRTLFRMNGPVNVDEAKERLKSRPCFFPDATTHQSKWSGKFRKFCNDFTQAVQDLEYNWAQWPAGEELTPEMVKDCFTACFQNTETTLGPDGNTVVLKSSNLALVRTYIKDYKRQTLEEIIEKIVAKFEARDLAVRTNKTSYPVQPWKTKENTKKKQFNQVAGSATVGQKRAREDGKPPTNNPRCNNCGSKGHICSERTCLFWGHQKAKGPNGSWPDGVPSLHLENDEMKAWKTIRAETFYAYPENQKKPKPKPK